MTGVMELSINADTFCSITHIHRIQRKDVMWTPALGRLAKSIKWN